MGPNKIINYKIAAAVAKSDDFLDKISLIMTTDIQSGILSMLIDDKNESVRQLAIKKSRDIQ
jgi:hypothetical protein